MTMQTKHLHLSEATPEKHEPQHCPAAPASFKKVRSVTQSVRSVVFEGDYNDSRLSAKHLNKKRAEIKNDKRTD